MNPKIAVKKQLIDYIAGLLSLTLIMTIAGCMLMATTGTTTTIMAMLLEWLL